MASTVYILFAWPLMVLALFALFPTRRAVLIAFLAAWLFLPMASFKSPGLPEYSKITATVIAVFVGMVLFDSKRLLALRPSWMDMPMVIWCCTPFISSVLNGLGVHDGLTMIYYQILTWAIPYVIGRVYFYNLEDLKSLGLGILIGGLIYVPLCLFETRMGPVLHEWVYGYMATAVLDERRGNGYRPAVFMQGGLAVGLWMADATVIAMWVWYTKAIRRVLSLPVGIAAISLCITTLLCKSVGAITIMWIALALLYIGYKWKKAVLFYCLVLFIPAYLSLRLANVINSHDLQAAMSTVFPKDRVDSFLFRVKNEEELCAKAWQQPIFGWGGWGRSDIQNEEGKYTSITDSLWIITFGMWGLVGVTALFTTLLLPAWMTWRRYPPSLDHPALVWLYLQAMLQVIFAIDCLSNAMLNPLFIVSMGGVAGFLMRPVAKQRNIARPAKIVRSRTSMPVGM